MAARDFNLEQGTPGEVLLVFLRLGLTSFGGPIAHLGYFRNELVVRRKWIDEAGYADLVALCQFLPGPTSSQVGFACGLMRAGPLGALAAWAAFTLPSAILLLIVASVTSVFDGPVGTGLLHGLKIVAVVVVAQAILGMARSLTPDKQRASIALAAALIEIMAPTSVGQIAAIGFGGVIGIVISWSEGTAAAPSVSFPISRRTGVVCILAFLMLLGVLPVASLLSGWHGLSVFDAFYRAGAFVFGGGHFVLPLLQQAIVGSGWVKADDFVAGYGITQAMPGPLFTFAAYLGAVMGPIPNGIVGAAIAIIAIFLPGLLLLVGVLPFWDGFRSHPQVQAVMRGANSAVVGILAVALYNPVWTSAILNQIDFALALTGFVLLAAWKCPPWIVVLVCAIAGVALRLIWTAA